VGDTREWPTISKLRLRIAANFSAEPPLAVATLIVCTFWGIASGLVGAVLVLMGVIAFNPMLRAGYDVKLASGVITAGGTLGILIPPSVMIIVYAAVAGQSVVKLYAAAMFPGFFLSFLYFIYIVGSAMINPKIAPPLPEEQTRVPVPDWMRKFQAAYSNNVFVGLLTALISPSKAIVIDTWQGRLTYVQLIKNFAATLVPFILTAGTLALVWWYVVIHQQAGPEAVYSGLEQLGTPGLGSGPATPAELGPPQGFYLWFGIIAAICALLQVRYYARLDADRF
jgi:TRAP-type mannitol/chloroaromatic compound transport system permease large subunit